MSSGSRVPELQAGDRRTRDEFERRYEATPHVMKAERIEGVVVPELAVEVAFTSVSYDLHEKLHVYRRAGVAEYVVHRARDGEVDCFVLRGGRFVRVDPDAGGTLRGEVFPGPWLDSAALQRGDPTALRATLRRGLATPEHAAFARRDQNG